MKSVLISIRPKWCDLIASGIKTVEVRKTRPQISTPIKCYIYCTKDPHTALMVGGGETKLISCMNSFSALPIGGNVGNGKVVGEFTCKLITGLKANNGIQTYYNGVKGTCLTDAEIIKYASGKMIYYWTISDLVIYDKPKELGEFEKPCVSEKCSYYEECGGIDGSCVFAHHIRPPQSWCYVEELQ